MTQWETVNCGEVVLPPPDYHRWLRLATNGAFYGWMCSDCGMFIASPYAERTPMCEVTGVPPAIDYIDATARPVEARPERMKGGHG